jgi:hypothetical protein
MVLGSIAGWGKRILLSRKRRGVLFGQLSVLLNKYGCGHEGDGVWLTVYLHLYEG